MEKLKPIEQSLQGMGWTYTHTMSNGRCVFQKHKAGEEETEYNMTLIDYNPLTHTLMIHNGQTYEDFQCCFDGVIKTTEELIVLLKQVGK
jgi:hypothetical protein